MQHISSHMGIICVSRQMSCKSLCIVMEMYDSPPQLTTLPTNPNLPTMKKFLFLVAAAIFTITMASNIDNSSATNFVFTVVDDAPVLPAAPFNYEVDIPEHITSAIPEPTGGYQSIDPDTALAVSVTDDGATLGRVLFYDKRLSALEDISCASCHLASQSFADNKDLSIGVNTLTSRNSMHLNDLGWSKNKGFFWDFRQEGLHEAIVLPLTDDNEIGADLIDITLKLATTDYYPELFQKAYGSSTITSNRVIDALVQFISSMNTFNSKFDKGAANDFINFNESENRGKELFATNCANCHTEGNGIANLEFSLGLTNSILFFPNLLNNGMDEHSTDVGIGAWLPGMDGLFKSPTLRNVELTGPYMHDGRFETLDEVIDFYSEDVVANSWESELLEVGGFQFTDQEKADLKAFMLTLTDHTVALNPKWSDPFANSTGTAELDIDVKVMPNPMDLYSDVVVDNEAGDRIDVSITDTQGRVVRSDYFIGDNYRIEKANFSTGMYFVTLRQDNKVATYKLLVK